MVNNQYLAAFVVGFIVIGFGVMSGWPSPTINLLTSDETPLSSGKITMQEASWFASLLPVGGFCSIILFGFVTKKFGRKGPLLGMSIPMIISWLLVVFAQNVYYLFVARLLHGFTAGGILVITPVYLIEISNDRNRGVLGLTLLLGGHFGVVLAFTFGNYFNFYVTPLFIIGLTILFAALFSLFPETPMFLMKQNKILEAERSLRFYRNIRGNMDNELIQLEMNKLKAAIDGRVKANSFDEKTSMWSGPGRKAFTIGIVLSVLNQFSGSFSMMNYTANIFEESGSTVTPNTSAMIVSIIQFVGTIVLAALVDRAGRKFSYIVSTLGSVFGLIALGVYMMLKSWNYDVEAYNWIPLVSFSFVIFFAACAISTLPITAIAELMPENIKEFGLSFCIAIISVCTFIALKYFPMLTEYIGFHGSMFSFAGFSLVCLVYIIFCMPETKGRSYDEIMKSLQ